MAGILNIGVTALNAYQRSLNLTSHNVANANTPGYSRQSSQAVAHEPTYSLGSYIGNGVQLSDVERAYDQFLVNQVRTTQSMASDLEVFSKYAGQIDTVVADPDVGLDAAVQDFFDAMQGLADDPGSTPVRELLLSESQSLVDRFHFIDRTLEDATGRLHADMENIVGEINDLAKTIAELNEAIATSPGIHRGAWPNDLLDQRDQAVNELTQFVSVNTLDQSNGMVNVYFGKGQPLVLDNQYNSLHLVDSPDFPGEKEIANSGGFIISNQISGGELGGLLRAREEVLDEGRHLLGQVAVGLSVEVNEQHNEGINLANQIGQDFFSDISVSQSWGSAYNQATTDYVYDITVTDPSKLPAGDFSLEFNGGDYTLTSLADDRVFTSAATAGALAWDLSADLGFSIADTAASTTIAAGDRFFFSPTGNAAEQLGLEVRDATDIAAAMPVEANPGGGNAGDGMVSLPAFTNVTSTPVTLAAPVTLTYTGPDFNVVGGPGGTISYDPATQSQGHTVRLAMGGYDMDIVIAGTPGVGDTFVIDNGTLARVSDNRNALLMADLQTWRGMQDGSATFQDTFGNYVATIGSKTRQANVNLDAQSRLLELNQDSLESVKGVNLDEEAANLIRFQQAYQAAAQVISTANTVFDSLISAVR